MKKENSAPTMKDVAREAGVALGTVSKVVNGLPVGETYKSRVEEAIRKLNYQVNSYAQGLKASAPYPQYLRTLLRLPCLPHQSCAFKKEIPYASLLHGL